jgi:hypothetical protein
MCFLRRLDFNKACVLLLCFLGGCGGKGSAYEYNCVVSK